MTSLYKAAMSPIGRFCCKVGCDGNEPLWLRLRAVALIRRPDALYATPTLRDIQNLLSLSETQSCWQLISNRAMLLPYARGL
jgi:hypothetical protein